MHPAATSADLPSTHDVSKYIHNSFIKFFDNLKATIQSNTMGQISITTDLWSVDQTKATFMGITAH
ncbi:hypothetical protein SCLCIDRAFT_72760, partial [Scleroderma citrinum Foug A]